MPRIRLQEKRFYEFTYETTVQARDLSSRGHLGSDAIVQIVHEGVVNVLRVLGYREQDLGDGRTGVIAGDTVVDFRSEAFLFDLLSVEGHIDEVNTGGFRVFHRIRRAEKLIALAESGLIGFDYVHRVIVPVPETFNRSLLRHSQDLPGPCRT